MSRLFLFLLLWLLTGVALAEVLSSRPRVYISRAEPKLFPTRDAVLEEAYESEGIRSVSKTFYSVTMRRSRMEQEGTDVVVIYDYPSHKSYVITPAAGVRAASVTEQSATGEVSNVRGYTKIGERTNLGRQCVLWRSPVGTVKMPAPLNVTYESQSTLCETEDGVRLSEDSETRIQGRLIKGSRQTTKITVGPLDAKLFEVPSGYRSPQLLASPRRSDGCTEAFEKDLKNSQMAAVQQPEALATLKDKGIPKMPGSEFSTEEGSLQSFYCLQVIAASSVSSDLNKSYRMCLGRAGRIKLDKFVADRRESESRMKESWEIYCRPIIERKQ